ncbi:MAG: hypothetical protein QGI33_00845 [Candidatus Brocadiia bacterium]|nr:hypothetical protein [Candidatus Brocadiia bacterium]
MITHAYRNVPYYRRLFDRSGIKPQVSRTVGDLRAIPTTGKNDLRDAPVADMVARGVDPDDLESPRTSGSSGEPFTIRSAWLEARIWGLFWARAMRYFGLRARDRAASILYIRPGRKPEDRKPYQRILNSFGLFRHVYVDCCP